MKDQINPERNIYYELEGIIFIWDITKSERNEKKHSISFEEAATVITNPSTRYFEDDDHSDDEERFIAIGFSRNMKFLTVCHCLRGVNKEIVRIISARKATKQEEKVYDRGED